jgi:hypothetical protein
VLVAAPAPSFELDDGADASAAGAPVADEAFAVAGDEFALDGEALGGESLDWDSLAPATLSLVEPVDELELSPEPASAPPLVGAAASLPAFPVWDSLSVVFAADAALTDVGAAERAAAAREMSATFAVTKWAVPAGASVIPAAVAKGATLFSEEYIESSMFS